MPGKLRATAQRLGHRGAVELAAERATLGGGSRVQATRRCAHQVGPAFDEPSPPGLVERGEPRTALVNVNIHHVDATTKAGWDADVRVRVTAPPGGDGAPVDVGVLVAVDRQGTLAAGDAWKDRHTRGRQVRCCRREIRCIDEVAQEPRPPPETGRSLIVQLVHAAHDAQPAHQKTPLPPTPLPGRAQDGRTCSGRVSAGHRHTQRRPSETSRSSAEGVTSSHVQDAKPALENAPTPRLLTSNGPRRRPT